MSLKEIEINFEEPYNKWADKIIDSLESHKIIYDTMMINRIQKSIIEKVNLYLIQVGYKPKDHLSYRINLVDRLKREGLKLSIRSNEILWKYLEYFLDLDDYTNCFDVEIIIGDYDKATKDMIFVSIRPNKINFAKEALIETNKHKINKENLDLVRKLNEQEKDEKIELILKVLDRLVEEED